MSLSFPGVNFFTLLGGSHTPQAYAFAGLIFERLTSPTVGPNRQPVPALFRPEDISSIELFPGSIVATLGMTSQAAADAVTAFAAGNNLCVKYQGVIYCTQSGVFDPNSGSSGNLGDNSDGGSGGSKTGASSGTTTTSSAVGPAATGALVSRASFLECRR